MSTISSCLFEEIYNEIPCEYDFSNLHDSIEKDFFLWGYGHSPEGFRWKSEYDSTLLDCSTWSIQLSIDSCKPVFFDESYVVKLAEEVFNEPKNRLIENIVFNLNQCDLRGGQPSLEYKISRAQADLTDYEVLKTSAHATIIRKISEGYQSSPYKKVITLLVDSIPADPYAVARSFWDVHRDYYIVNLVVDKINSSICTGIEFTYLFDREMSSI